LFEEDSSDCDASVSEALPQETRCKGPLQKPPVDSASRPTAMGVSLFHHSAFGSIASTLSTPTLKPWKLHVASDCLQFAVSGYYTLGQYVLGVRLYITLTLIQL
jgi:hypothetical protein